MSESLAQLRDAVLAAHQSNGADWCLDCDRDWPCPEYRLATLLSVENVEEGFDQHRDKDHHALDYDGCYGHCAAALLGAIGASHD